MVMKLFPDNLLDLIGGPGPFEAVAKDFYQHSFSDPILGVLYEDKTEPHDLMMCRWFFEQNGLTDEMTKRGGSKLINAKHRKAENRPERATAPKEAGYVGGAFTKAQRNRWLRYQLMACEDFNLPKEFVRGYIHGLCVFMSAYGPFVESRVEDGPQTGKCPASVSVTTTPEQAKILTVHPNLPGYDMPGELGNFQKITIPEECRATGATPLPAFAK
ncbi:hypothetical protein Pmar_PMAR024132 [Perkinsus marinus ATCC 50983]|uniref:Uncharacterized protein n=1 Tax=Perkinsus marinus (strain ATCC 50983 / TXsc) TaxID=423536 RepID=C5L296_PERM5|nr:hypothetical protein Pmar_PMAR024132 [Perkinsus marinus ATCC 50983]EER09108.1 hypothetical protein Pmar_PMAR024132 [Perkinsus marinus ATCC 50983]|eukprot:XP_002777292.1 hypothetical protein Pmar_PMAR024132 [Perkinsus marinus ATCC 50983]